MEQIISRAEIERSARLAVASGECRNPYPSGSAAHDEWHAVFEGLMSEAAASRSPGARMPMVMRYRAQGSPH